MDTNIFFFIVNLLFLYQKYFIIGKEGGKERGKEEDEIRNRARIMKFPIQRTKTASVRAGARYAELSGPRLAISTTLYCL